MKASLRVLSKDGEVEKRSTRILTDEECRRLTFRSPDRNIFPNYHLLLLDTSEAQPVLYVKPEAV